MRAVATVQSDAVLANAVAADDVAATTAEVRALVYNHEHIVRLRVLRDGVVLDDFGGPTCALAGPRDAAPARHDRSGHSSSRCRTTPATASSRSV